MWLREKKKLKSLIGFLSANKINTYNSANKINTYNRGGKKWGKKQKNPKNLKNKSKHKNNNCFSWVTAVRVLSLAGSCSLPYFPRKPSSTVLISGPAVDAAQILIWSHFCVFFPPVSKAIRARVFSFMGSLNALLYIPSIESA